MEKMKYPEPPQNGFVLITNSKGEIVNHLPSTCTSEQVFALVSFYDTNQNENVPHSGWRQDVGGFSRVLY